MWSVFLYISYPNCPHAAFSLQYSIFRPLFSDQIYPVLCTGFVLILSLVARIYLVFIIMISSLLILHKNFGVFIEFKTTLIHTKVICSVGAVWVWYIEKNFILSHCVFDMFYLRQQNIHYEDICFIPLHCVG